MLLINVQYSLFISKAKSRAKTSLNMRFPVKVLSLFNGNCMVLRHKDGRDGRGKILLEDPAMR